MIEPLPKSTKIQLGLLLGAYFTFTGFVLVWLITHWETGP